MKLGRIVLVALLGGAVTAVGATGCSLIVDFDASKIDSGIGNNDASGDDAGDVGPDTADSNAPDTTVDDAADTAVADANDAADTAVGDAADATDANDAADTAVADANDAADTAVADTAVADTNDAADTAPSQVCGNAAVEGTEACDLGGKNGTLTCLYGLTTCAVCTSGCAVGTPVTSFCSDGIVDTAHEQCDDTNTTAGDGCSTGCAKETGWNCTGAPSVCTPICGDGVVKGSEQCDLATNNGKLTCAYGATSCAVCTSTCQNAAGTTSYCGDSKIDATNAETCDDGAAAPGDGCSATCTVETNFKCVSVSLPSTCASTLGDDNVHWDTLYFSNGAAPDLESVPNKSYKFFTPSTATITATTTVDVYMLADVGDLSAATIQWSDGMSDTPIAMSWVDVTTAAVHGAASHTYAVWKGTIPAHAAGTYFYRLWAIDQTKTAYLKSAVPVGSTTDCSAAALTQEICSVDTYIDGNWSYTVLP